MVWIEEKMKLLGCTTNPNYKVIHFKNQHLYKIINVQDTIHAKITMFDLQRYP